MNIVLQGIGVSAGIAMGKIHVLANQKYEITDDRISDTDLEIVKLESSLIKCGKQINELFEKAMKEIGEDEAQIFEAHLMILEDKVFLDEIKGLIVNDKLNAACSTQTVTQKYVDMFNSMEDEYLKERAADLKDVSSRIIKNILGIKMDIYSLCEDVIIVAEDLTPSDTAALDKKHVLGFITKEGGATSHTAIISRTLEIPAIVGLEELASLNEHDYVVMDGENGTIIKNPSEKQTREYAKKQVELTSKKEIYYQYIDKETVTKDGRQVSLGANIGNVEDLEAALKNGIEGVGLFRTELFYLQRNSLPSEEEQFEVYKELAEKLEGKPLIIRTLDVGGDKEIPYMDMPKELNPFLGYRAIRLCLDKKKIFLTQLKAILRAGLYGDVKILIPMISSMEELLLAKDIIEEVKEELRNSDILFGDDIEIGMMIEVPSAAIMSDMLAKEVDFFSIGTNDLIQYTTAVDRGNKKVCHLYNEFNPGVLRLIDIVIQNAHKQGIWVGMCGEAASSNTLVPLLLAMGLDEFSMNSVKVPEIRWMLSKIEYKKTKELTKVLSLSTSNEVVKSLEKFIEENVKTGEADETK